MQLSLHSFSTLIYCFCPILSVFRVFAISPLFINDFHYQHADATCRRQLPPSLVHIKTLSRRHLLLRLRSSSRGWDLICEPQPPEILNSRIEYLQKSGTWEFWTLNLNLYCESTNKPVCSQHFATETLAKASRYHRHATQIKICRG
jgi:hypothetical protein